MPCIMQMNTIASEKLLPASESNAGPSKNKFTIERLSSELAGPGLIMFLIRK